jgi:hypothetical protein
MELRTEFEDKWDENDYAHQLIGESIGNLVTHAKQVEEYLKGFPPPNADMIQYQPDGYDRHLNLKELFDEIFSKLNKFEKYLDTVTDDGK